MTVTGTDSATLDGAAGLDPNDPAGGAPELAATTAATTAPSTPTGLCVWIPAARAAASSLNGRLVHLVVGGAWQHLGGLPVHVVSAASSADLLEAMRVCVAWEASLGWYWAGERYERIDEFTIVSLIRAKLCVADPVFAPA